MTTTTVTAEDLRNAISMPEAISAVRQAFIGLVGGDFEQPTRTVLRDGQFLVMSAHHRPSASAMVKTLSLNFERVPAITGTVVWTNTASLHRIVADAASITALRTGAIVGVATDLLAQSDAGRMVLIGAGGQAADQIRGVHAVRPLRSLTLVDSSPGRAEALLDNMSCELAGVDAQVSTSIVDAVSDTDIVCCATPSAVPLFSAGDLPSQVHVNAIGAFRPTMRELPADLLAQATIVVDELDAVLEESGEVIDALAAGVISNTDLVTLGSALRSGLAAPQKRTVFKTVGVAVQDWAIAHALAEKLLVST